MNNNDYCFIYRENKLLVLVKNETITIPMVKDFKELAINTTSKRVFRNYNGVDCYYLQASLEVNEKEMEFRELRQLSGIFDEELFHLSCRGIHLLRWYENNGFCPKCGERAEDLKEENGKICPKCGYLNYPRISPAIIVAITKEDKLLLAHNSKFTKGMYSVLAGFVEPGETFEECVAREVFEETGILVKNIKYFGSQPWPFPDSLMIGFTAEYAGGEIVEDGVEIIDAKWYRANEIPMSPSNGSVAAKLIRNFIENHG